MLINLRNALMAGRRLPYDAEVEYLESTGTQYINTGVKGQSGIDLDFGFSCTSIGSVQAIGGCWTALQSLYVGIVRVNGYFAYHYGNTNGSIVQVQQVSANTYYHVQAHLYYGEQYYTLNGNKSAVGTIAGYFVSPLNIHLFRINATAPTYSNGVRVYALKIYVNGVLTRDYIPVRKGAVGYLYDRVTGKLFGNAGTGDFVLGPDVVPVEWLSSDGAQYIDTGYVFQFGDDISATFQPLATPTQTAYFFGADTAYNAGLNVHYDPSYSNIGLRYCYGGGFGVDNNTGVIMSPVQAFSASTIYACNGNANKRTINSGENTVSVQDSGLNNASVILFCGRRDASVRSASTGWAVASRFFGFDAKRNGAGVRAMKPVRVGTEGAMMDTLTRRIYRNQGTGAFSYGNDLPYPIPA